MQQENLHEAWLKRLEQWKASGKSGQAWARNEGISPHVFAYWKKKLLGVSKTANVPQASPFIELTASRGLSLKWHDVVLHIPADFDENALKRFLLVLRGISC